ncbi:glycosyltransferase family 2 protein [Klebsiella pneumoniae]|uniref:glycosyltransferase family 2 protein n=1 Tax=Klebsiella pneumoniae TaxID=573 RepID=UPI0024DEC363|nr:glycosyltransferase family A protein [Klebsiella pneumoniae]MDK1956585.1 glycosyltransferase family 2 protein [Klebsiella pneumoniae]
MDKLLFTVIVPTFNDVPRTNKCINSLIKQTISSCLYEVIIVDNNPQLLDYCDVPSNFKIIHEPTPGSYAARNTALKLANGKYIAFTDADCIVSPEWLESAQKYLDNRTDRVAGNIKLFDETGTNKMTFSGCYEKAYAFDQKINASRGECVTVNLIIHKSFIDRVGYFDSNLFSGGDIEWNLRATKDNIGIVYADDVIVMHPIRASFKEIISKRVRVIGGQYKKISIIGTLKFLLPSIKDIAYLSARPELTKIEKTSAFLI